MAKLQLSLLVGFSFLCSCTATVFTVGDTAGWDISSDLDSWAAANVFKVGDVLLFQYSSYHSVEEVAKDGFDACDATNALLTSKDGNTSIPLPKEGERYFICGSSTHCLGGMKLQVNVNGDAHAPAAAAAPLAPKLYDAPTSLPNPSFQKKNPSTPSTSTGFSHTARVKLAATCFSLLWIVFLV